MSQRLHAMALLVRDYDEAIEFYTKAMRFELIEDTMMSETKRWVVVSPRGAKDNSCYFILAKAANEDQISAIGNQSGGRVFLFLHTDNFQDDINHMKAHGVRFTEEPRYETYGTVVVIQDIYGNKWDIIQPK
jgi:catechol 2,3-dioxygenase-like lactoylglutathione lyase family enzyme